MNGEAHMRGATSMLATMVGALFVPSPTAASTAAGRHCVSNSTIKRTRHHCSSSIQNRTMHSHAGAGPVDNGDGTRC